MKDGKEDEGEEEEDEMLIEEEEGEEEEEDEGVVVVAEEARAVIPMEDSMEVAEMKLGRSVYTYTRGCHYSVECSRRHNRCADEEDERKRTDDVFPLFDLAVTLSF